MAFWDQEFLQIFRKESWESKGPTPGNEASLNGIINHPETKRPYFWGGAKPFHKLPSFPTWHVRQATHPKGLA